MTDGDNVHAAMVRAGCNAVYALGPEPINTCSAIVPQIAESLGRFGGSKADARPRR